MTTVITTRPLSRTGDSWLNSRFNIEGTQDVVYLSDKGRYAFTGYLGQLCKFIREQPGMPGVKLETIAIHHVGKPMEFWAYLSAGKGNKKFSRKMRVTQNLFTLLCSVKQNNSADMLDEAIAEVVMLTESPSLAVAFYPKEEEVLAM